MWPSSVRRSQANPDRSRELVVASFTAQAISDAIEFFHSKSHTDSMEKYISGLILTTSLFIVILNSCSSHTVREPQSITTIDTDLLSQLQTLDADLKIRQINSTNCHPYFQNALTSLQEDLLQKIPIQNADSMARQITELTWGIRLESHKQLSELTTCRTELRQLFFRLRSIEDMALDFVYRVPQLRATEIDDYQKQPTPLVDNEFFNGYLGPSGKLEKLPVDFQSGDLMVTRGPSFFSAALGLIADHPSQLDHFVLINKDTSGRLNTIESYADTGGVSRFEMGFALRNANLRILLLRPKDGQVGAKAAQIMMNRTLEADQDKRKQIRYDYVMNLEDEKRMTCSEVTYWGYRLASDGKFLIPEEKSTVSPKLKQIFDKTGISPKPMLTAGDIELDSRFDLVLEFRDPRLIQDSRVREGVMQSVFQWMKEKQYELRPTLSTLAINTIIYPTRRTPLWPFIRRVTGSPDFPTDTPKGFLKTLSMMNDVGDILYNKLDKENRRHRNKTGWGMTQNQMKDFLERYREEDLKKYESGSSPAPDFHFLFNPSWADRKLPFSG